VTGGGGEFEADEPRTDHNDALTRRDPPPQRLALVQRPQIAYLRQVGIGKIEQAIARAQCALVCAVRVNSGARGHEIEVGRLLSASCDNRAVRARLCRG